MPYQIDPCNLERFFDKIKGLNKRIETINSKNTQEKIAKIEILNLVHKEAVYVEGYYERKIQDACIEFDILGIDTNIKFNGWSFLGIIEHTQDDIILRSKPNAEIPFDLYKEATPKCDHCGTRRARKETAIVYNEDTKEYKQLGLKCVSLYTLSKTAQYYVNLYKNVFEIIEGCKTRKGEYGLWIKSVLAHASYCAERFGIITKDDEESRKFKTTKRTARSFCTNFHTATEKDYFIRNYGSFPLEINDSHWRKADLALEFILAKESNNSFVQNLQVIAKMTEITQKHFNLCCWIMFLYLQEIEKQEKIKIEKASRTNAFVGKIGDKVEFKGVCLSSYYIETSYGASYINTFKDDTGNLYKWFTKQEFSKDKRFFIMATVKAHETYKEQNSTVITRAKVKVIDEG